MKVIVINSGSSSIKYQLFEMTKETVLAKGIAEKIGENNSEIVLKISEKKQKIEKQYNKIENHKEALSEILKLLEEYKLIQDKKEITAIGHRLVHAGENYHSSVVITEDVLEKMTECNDLAPLHNPHNITGVRTTQELFPGTFQAGCFDTAFHQTMPDYAYIYPIDYSYYEKYKVRRYGFHGISHQYLLKESAKRLNKPIEQCNIITLHLGNGASVTAIKNGKVIDTSMGFTPLEGLVMGTRVGDIDGGILIYLQEKLKLSPDEINHILNYRSGLKGICGTNDMREIIQNMKQGDKDSSLAFKIFCLKIKKYIGSYIALIGKIDAIVFSGGIGENSQEVRDEVCKEMEHLGVTSKKIFVIKTNEELEMARETIKILNSDWRK